MSLWGATVITNLLSAIPWIGNDITEFINHHYLKHLFFFYSFSTIIFAGLPVIGTVNSKSRTSKSNRLSMTEYLSTPRSFLAFLIGFIDGDGYIQVTRTTKGLITIKLTISLHLDDLSTLEYIHSVLKIGKLNEYKDYKSPTCRLVINRIDLQEILFPLLIHHNIFFLTNTRADQFNLALYILKNDIKFYDQIPTDIPPFFEQPKDPLDYTLLHFFKNWIVGFACAEGSFLVKSNNDGCFQLKQRIHTNLFEAFKLVFDTKRKINATNNYNQNTKNLRFLVFGVCSKCDIQKVVNFFSFNGLHPLVGLKYIQYAKWLENMRKSYRYCNLNNPTK